MCGDGGSCSAGDTLARILLASAAQRECQSALSVTQSDTSLIVMG
jgi:hypothetical protein